MVNYAGKYKSFAEKARLLIATSNIKVIFVKN